MRSGAQQLPNLPPLTAEELTLQDNPAAPGAPAMILYYAVDTDNTKSTETESLRIKVFRDEGKKYADVEIPYYQKYAEVTEIRARTVGQDGRVAEFTGQIYDREVLKYRKLGLSTKVFSISDVHPGSIIEYSYRLHSDFKLPDAFRHPQEYRFTRGFTYPAARWDVQRDLFLKHGRFVLHPVKGASVRERYQNLPTGLTVKLDNAGSLELDVDNIPAYEEEEYAPPEATLKTRVDLFYQAGFYTDEYFWKDLARSRAEGLESFYGKPKVAEREVARLIDSKDPDLTKLRKLYDRAQQIRAVSYEGEKSQKQMKQENLKENKNVEDVLTHGYAFANEIDLVFVALARAAGFRAYPINVTGRKQSFFAQEYPNEQQLTAMVVAVRVGENTTFLDPATRFCPFGLLPWEETSAGGIVLDSARPAMGETPGSKSADAITQTVARLRLDGRGSLNGDVKVSYSGQPALSLRLAALQQDDVARSKALEESMSNKLPQGASVTLLRANGWDNPYMPLATEFEVDIPEFASLAGSRMILPMNVFHSRDKNPFSSARRQHNIYFDYAAEAYEDIEIALPSEFDVESVPAGKKADNGSAFYELLAKQESRTLRLNRSYRIGWYYFDTKQYPLMREFFTSVLAGDTQQISLRLTKAANSK
jgi:hypothetical protein